MEEIWKDIKGYEGLYQVSNLGNVKSLNYNHKNIVKNLKPTLYFKRYKAVSLFNNKKKKVFLVHRLVALTFIPNYENKPFVNHIDGNKFNNKLENLEWVTNSENQKHAHKIGLNFSPSKNKFGADNYLSKPVIKYNLKGEKIKIFGGIREAERYTGIKRSCIINCCKGKQKTAGGFIWKYNNK